MIYVDTKYTTEIKLIINMHESWEGRIKKYQDNCTIQNVYTCLSIRHRYAICVVDINVKHVHRQYPSSQPELSGTARRILELLCVSNNETYLPGFTKSEVDTMINALCTC